MEEPQITNIHKTPRRQSKQSALVPCKVIATLESHKVLNNKTQNPHKQLKQPKQ